MNPPLKMLMVLGTVGALTFATSTADAQRVQRFDDQGEGGGGQVVLPGAPAPEQPEPEVQYVDPPADGEASEEGDGRPVGSYRIQVHGASGSQPSGQSLQELLARDRTELYRGVIPGERDEVEHLQRAKEEGQSSNRPNPITWVGFQPEENRTRVFFQSPRPVQYQLRDISSEGELVVTFSNARIPERNFSRFIDASHFNRSVKRIDVEEVRGGNVEVTLKLRERVNPSVSTDGEYLYLDFPHDAGAAATHADAD